MKRILLIGASGQLGRSMSRLYSLRKDVELIETHRHHKDGKLRIDITDPDSIQCAIAEIKPDVVVNAAACADVDRCEVEPEKTHRVNVNGAASVAEACENYSAWCVHFSTDYVFDGDSGPYCSTDPISPINAYGRQKALAEELVVERCANAIVLRVSQIYCGPPHPVGFVKRLLDADDRAQTLAASRYHHCTPVHVGDIMQRIDLLLKNGKRGLQHVAGPDHVTRYEALVIARRALGLSRVFLEPLDQLKKQHAARPLLAGLVDGPSMTTSTTRSIEQHLSGLV